MKERAPWGLGEKTMKMVYNIIRYYILLLTIYKHDAFIFFTKRYSFTELVFCFLGNFEFDFF